MKFLLAVLFQAILIININGLFHSRKTSQIDTSDYRVLSSVKIYSNLAEIIQPLGKLPMEFSAEDWNDIRADSITLVGKDVAVNQQTVTEKKKSLDGGQVFVRSPASSSSETKFVRATIIDEKVNLVKVIDKDISKEPIFFTVPDNQIVHDTEPPKTKYYVDFNYTTTEAVSVSYLRSNLKWKTRYQLNLFEDSHEPVLIAMADIRNDGNSKIDIENAELLGGDINLRKKEYEGFGGYPRIEYAGARSFKTMGPRGPIADGDELPTVAEAEELSGLYVFPITQSFSIDSKSDYILPMFRPRVTVERFASINRILMGGNITVKGRAQRSYSLSSDRFLSSGNCILRESDHLVGETKLPNIAAKDKHDFSIGEDADVTFKVNTTEISSRPLSDSHRQSGMEIHGQIQSVFDVSVQLKNYKKNRPVKVKYEETIFGQSVKFIGTNPVFTTEGPTIKCTVTLPADSEKVFKYTVQTVH